ncbi:unnamed protein product [Caenorhabditis nigoni]
MAKPPETVQKEGKEPRRGTDETAFRFNFFADLLHGIYPGDNRDDIRSSWEELHTDNDMTSLVEFIGGFEKWTELNDDCRMAVVKHLEYNDRCKLGICSKKDYETVKSTPLAVYSIYIENDTLIEYDNVTVSVHFHNDGSLRNKIQLIFSQLGEDTQVRWYEDYQKEKDYHQWLKEKDAQVNSSHNRWAETFSDSYKERLEKRVMVLKSCDYNEEAVKFAEKWMKKCNFELKEIFIKIKNYPVDKSQIKSLPKCKYIFFGADDVETFRWWIQKLPNQMEIIQLSRLSNEQEIFTIPSVLLNAPQIMQALDFDFWCRADFSDEQFLNLKANEFEFDCVKITDQGINKFITQWVNGNGVPDFKKAVFSKIKDRNFDEMTRGIEYREWYGDFKKDEPYFCHFFYDEYKSERCVQIYSKVDPYESLTLSISSDCVSIHKTGNKMENNGKPYTHYSIPD